MTTEQDAAVPDPVPLDWTPPEHLSVTDAPHPEWDDDEARRLQVLHGIDSERKRSATPNKKEK